MTLRTFITFLTLLFVTHVLGQTRTLTGKIIDHEFNSFPFVSISNADTVLLSTSDMNGNFSVTIPYATKTLIVATVGMEWKSLEITDNCINLEIILLPSWTYDFIPLKKVDRLRKKEFNKLPKLHKAAFEKGLFKSVKPCYVDNFISLKKVMIERHKARTRKPST